METTVEKTDVQQREAVAPGNWDALNSSAQFGDVDLLEKKEEAKQAEKEIEVKQDVEGKTETETKEEPVKEEVKETKEEEKKEPVKEEKADEIKEEVEFSPEDVGVKPEHEDGSWLKLSQELLGDEIAEDSFEAFKAANEARIKAAEEKGRALTKEVLFSEMKPEVALALKRIEAGMAPEMAINPTAQVDAALALDDASIIRAELELTEGWDQERIDTHMEILTENPKRLSHEASLIRDGLKQTKAQLENEANQYLQQYEQNKGRVAQQQLVQEKAQIVDSLKSVKEYLGGKLPEATVNAVIQKFNQGGYDNLFNDPAAKARFILQETFGEKAIKAKIDAAYQSGKLEKVKQLSNVPPVDSKVAKSVEGKVNQISQWDALERSVFGEEKK